MAYDFLCWVLDAACLAVYITLGGTLLNCTTVSFDANLYTSVVSGLIILVIWVAFCPGSGGFHLIY